MSPRLAVEKAQGSAPPLLEVRNVTKSFGSLKANDGISLDIRAGEIHVILGENGAGKSTLMKMLYGLYPPDEGTVHMNGVPVSLFPPVKANQLGVRMVFQQFTLIPSFTVIENMRLFLSPAERKRSAADLRRQIDDTAEKYGLDVRPDAHVWELDLGERQRVEILKALVSDSVKLIIFDEPTSVLTPQEVEGFIAMLKRLADSGIAVLLITHKIPEVFACAHRVTVLSAGRVVHQVDDVTTTTPEELVQAMIGPSAEASDVLKRQAASSRTESVHVAAGNGGRRVVLDVQDVSVTNNQGRLIVAGANLRVHRGEIVGIAGISGNGQRELLEALFGVRKTRGGRINMSDHDMTGADPAAFLDHGVSFLPGDLIRDSVIPNLTVLEHMVLGGVKMHRKRFGIDWDLVRQELSVLHLIRSLRMAPWERRVDTLSGGNVQRVMLARTVAANPSLLLLSYPTRGLDIALVRNVHRLVAEMASKGCGIVYLSEDLSELFSISDTLYVLGHGGLKGPYPTDSTNPFEIGQLMAGGEESA